MANLKDLETGIRTAAKNICSSKESLGKDERKNLIEACDQLKASLETPVDLAFKLVFSIHQFTAVRIAIEMGIFRIMASTKSSTVGLDRLAADTHADRLLIVRIIRLLVAIGIFQEVEKERYSSSPIAEAFVAGSPLGDALTHFHDVHANVFVKLPKYLFETGFRNPNEASKGPFQHAFDTPLHHFEWLKKNPRQLKAFNSLMTAQRADKGEDWFKFFPVEEHLNHTSSIDLSTLLVDVGGGLGTDLIAFRTHHPLLLGQLVLQDLPETIVAAKGLPEGLVTMAHDFFTPQPIKGASFYYLRTILHDWPDKEARLILENLRSAMAPHSMLLINEYVLSDSGVPLLSAQLDLSMMAIFSSQERTREQWEKLLESAGFQTLKIWTPPCMHVGQASLIEARARSFPS